MDRERNGEKSSQDLLNNKAIASVRNCGNLNLKIFLELKSEVYSKESR